MHGYLSRDGIAPDNFRQRALEELKRYPTVSFRNEEVVSAARGPGPSFTVLLEGRESARAKKLLLATGVMDQLPHIANIEAYFGTSVFPCPYCDGWELRGAPIAVFGDAVRGFEMARAMTAWTDEIVLCTHGPADFGRRRRQSLSANGIEVETSPIVGLEGEDGRLRAIRFDNGRVIERSALFFDTPCRAQSQLARSLGCEFTPRGGIRCGRYEASSVPGVFVAGNILKDVQLSIVAAAEGARAAFGINRALTREAFSRKAGALEPLDHPGPDTADAMSQGSS
jgi:thioredoxin reductase